MRDNEAEWARASRPRPDSLLQASCCRCAAQPILPETSLRPDMTLEAQYPTWTRICLNAQSFPRACSLKNSVQSDLTAKWKRLRPRPLLPGQLLIRRRPDSFYLAAFLRLGLAWLG